MMVPQQPGVVRLPGVVLHMDGIAIKDQVIVERWNFPIKDEFQAAAVVGVEGESTSTITAGLMQTSLFPAWVSIGPHTTETSG